MLLETLTVLENLRIACQAFHASRHSLFRSRRSFSDVVRKAHDAAEQMHLEHVLSRNVNELSYGQKRQLEVAIALCAEPRILLMDEPAAGTSPDERTNLIKLINSLSPELTILLVEHDMDVVIRDEDAFVGAMAKQQRGKVTVSGFVSIRKLVAEHR
jgi:branched-chain amino acid transport system ATP-binding protein